MPRSFFLLFSLVWLVAGPACAQLVTGRVADAKTGQALPFVNIGVVGKARGTVTNEQGQFQLDFPASLAADTVRISYLGYQPVKLTVRQLSAQPVVRLSPAAVALGEVQVKASSVFKRTRTLGFTGNSESTTLSLESKDLGAEIGTVVHLKQKPAKVLNANFNVAYNHLGKITLRINFYRLGPDGKPTEEKLLPREVIVHTDVTHGPITVDLIADKLLLDEDFFLTIEWVGGASAAKIHEGLAFSAGLGYADNDIYVRAASQDAWEKISAGALFAGMQFKLGFFVAVQE